MMECFKNCCETEEDNKTQTILSNENKMPINPKDANKESNTKALTEFYSSLQGVIQQLKNIGNKQQAKDPKEMLDVITNIAKEHNQQIEENKAMAKKLEQQIKDINDMKQNINKITEEAQADGELKIIGLELKKIEENDKLNDVIGKITDSLANALKKLKELNDEKTQLVGNLDDIIKTNYSLEEQKAKQEKQANILAQSYAAGVTAPDINSIDKDSSTNKDLIDIFGNHTTVYFLSTDGTLLQGEQLIKNYDPKNFDSSRFYYLGEDDKYQILDNLKDIDGLDTSRIILAYQKKN